MKAQTLIPISATGAAAGALTLNLPPGYTQSGPHVVSDVTDLGAGVAQISITANLTTIHGLTADAGKNQFVAMVTELPDVTGFTLGRSYPATITTAGATTIFTVPASVTGIYSAGGRILVTLLNHEPQTFYVDSIDIALQAGASAVATAGIMVTTTGMGGLKIPMGGAVAVNSIDRVVYRPAVPLALTKIIGANPTIVAPATTNGTWTIQVSGYFG